MNGDYPVYAHADSGATSTLINLDYLKLVGLSDMIEYYKKDSPSYTVAHGGVASFLGRIPRLGIKLADHIEIFLSVHVVPRAPYTLLLGADFLTSVGGVIDYATGEFHYRYDPGDGKTITSTQRLIRPKDIPLFVRHEGSASEDVKPGKNGEGADVDDDPPKKALNFSEIRQLCGYIYDDSPRDLPRKAGYTQT